jgi:translation initiation factor 5B
MEINLRQPIVTVAGHVDHGKTSILDKLRGTSVQSGEAGGITQKISFTTLPRENVLERAGTILEKFKIPLEIPGFLFIDTPGHAAFTNLRKRGGSLADIAILVIDVNEGLKPQTQEVLKILKANKTPFIIALNKIDNISGWKKAESGFVLDSVERQAINVSQNFEEKYYTIIGALNSYGIDAELYFKISDFTKKVAIVPCSARTGEGISEILAMLSALSQRFLKERLKTKESGKGVVLEVKKEKSNTFLECILYDGELNEDDEIAIASFGEPLITRVRSIQETLPLNRGFKAEKTVKAATGLRLQLTAKEDILPGMPFIVLKDNLESIKEEFSKEISEDIQTDKSGIFIKAESLGSLEALLFLLKQKQIRVIKADIGPITKRDISFANSLPETDKIILAFNVGLTEEAKAEDLKKIKIISNEVVYKIIEDLEEWQQNKQKEIERQKLNELPNICKIKILDFVFRNTNPAIFGIVVEGGVLTQELEMINSLDKKIGRIKTIQENKDTMKQAEKGKEVAISIPGVNFERELKVGESLFSNLSEFQFRKFKEYKDLLTSEEKAILQEIAKVKRRENMTWGL